MIMCCNGDGSCSIVVTTTTPVNKLPPYLISYNVILLPSLCTHLRFSFVRRGEGETASFPWLPTRYKFLRRVLHPGRDLFFPSMTAHRLSFGTACSSAPFIIPLPLLVPRINRSLPAPLGPSQMVADTRQVVSVVRHCPQCAVNQLHGYCGHSGNRRW